jgi:hypothetical protein
LKNRPAPPRDLDAGRPTGVDYVARHVRFGWWSLVAFAALGFGLEMLHAFKVRAYLDVSNEPRRLMWTLAHAHGTLLSIIHVVYGLFLSSVSDSHGSRLVSNCLIGASILLPGGFFLGGVRFYGGDPGVGAVLIPVGAALFLLAVARVATAPFRRRLG